MQIQAQPEVIQRRTGDLMWQIWTLEEIIEAQNKEIQRLMNKYEPKPPVVEV
jgi:hypothetical protein